MRLSLGITPRSYVPLGGASTDPDAQAFITAAGITDATQQSAVNQLVLDLKGYSIWTKMKAIYPIVGGTSTTHKYNLKDPRDLDAAYRLTFTTGWTHSSNGMLPNGASYANTFVIPSTSLTLNNTHISYYSRTNNTLQQQEIGAGQNNLSLNTPTISLMCFYNFNASQKGVFYCYNGQTATDAVYANNTNTNSLGFYQGNRTSSTSNKYIKNGTVIGTNTTSGNPYQPNSQIFIGCQNFSGSPYQYTTKQCAFASIGDGLTDTEAANFYTAVQNYQTTLGRQV